MSKPWTSQLSLSATKTHLGITSSLALYNPIYIVAYLPSHGITMIILSVHFNHYYCTEICDKLSMDSAMLTYIYLNVDDS